MRYTPRSSVVSDPDCCSVFSPVRITKRIARTCVPGDGSPFSSTTTPVRTLPLGRWTLILSSFWPSASVIGVPGRPGFFAP